MHKPFALLALTALAGCATNFKPKPLPPNHPANAQAEEAPRSARRRLIAADELSRKSELQLTRKDLPKPDFQSGGMSHDMSDKSASPAASATAAVYTCPMHPDVSLPAPGKCPKCGMKLVEKEGGTK